jgi:uncharacterized protein YjeT (DUF2065 family)
MNENFSTNLEGLKGTDVQIWREAITQLRHLSDDVLQGLRIFLGMNVVLLIGLVVLGVIDPCGMGSGILCALLSLAGVFLTAAGRYVLKRNRIYYLEMLGKKSLLEMDLGFYQRKLGGSETDLALPWRLKPEVVAEIARNFDAWVQKSIRSKGTIARVYFLIYEVLFGAYVAAMVMALVRFLR